LEILSNCKDCSKSRIRISAPASFSVLGQFFHCTGQFSGSQVALRRVSIVIGGYLKAGTSFLREFQEEFSEIENVFIEESRNFSFSFST
jgi:hypothetical protein